MRDWPDPKTTLSIFSVYDINAYHQFYAQKIKVAKNPVGN